MDDSTPPPTTLAQLFLGFLSIGAMSFGGGLVAWIRREAVHRRGWMDDTKFLTAYGLSQIVPGANNVNLAVFIGSELRGAAGAAAAVVGLMAVPIAFYVAVGALFLAIQGTAAGPVVARGLAGMGAVAIGLNLATGYRLGRSNIAGAPALAIATVTAVSVGLLSVPLPIALAVLIPVSLLLAWRRT